MERIKKAVEKARARREAGGGAAAPRTQAQERGFRPGISVPVGIGPEFSYSTTPTVSVSRELLRENRVIVGSEDPGASAYKILRTQTLQRMNDNKWNTLAVTSPNIAAGKTLTAINLAVSIAMEVTKTVLLIDADLRRPSVHRFFGLNPKKGLSDYLIEGGDIQELLIHPNVGRIVILPGGQPLQNSSEMLGSPRMAHLVEEVKERYPERVVVFDLPPVLAVDDALAFSPYVDACLLVVEEGRTQQDELTGAAELLQGTTNIVGTVLNKSRLPSQPYY